LSMAEGWLTDDGRTAEGALRARRLFEEHLPTTGKTDPHTTLRPEIRSGEPALHRRRVPAEIAVTGIAKQGGELVGLIVESQPVHGRQQREQPVLFHHGVRGMAPVAEMRDDPVRESRGMIAQAQSIEQAQEVGNRVRVINRKNARRDAAPIRIREDRRLSIDVLVSVRIGLVYQVEDGFKLRAAVIGAG